jgi:3-oxoacyl-[acyl-carrier-protein] synthase-3
MSERYARIAATGRFVPPIQVSNAVLHAQLESKFPEFIEKMEASSGIRTRWHAPEDWATSDVALPAAEQAIRRAGLKPDDIDLIVLGTDSPDYVTPATSVVLQHKLRASRAGTFDVGCACASFPTGIAAAAGILTANRTMKAALVVGVYLMHKLAAADDPLNFFYGDGSGAVVLAPSDEPGFLGSAFLADGAYARYWGIFAGGTVEPATEDAVRSGRTTVKMLERYPPEVNHEGWPKLVRRLAEQQGFRVADIDFIIFTQVRKPSIELVMADLGIPMEKTVTVMEEWGYTGSACIPMALDRAMELKEIEPGDLVVLVGSGVGYNQAAVAYRA